MAWVREIRKGVEIRTWKKDEKSTENVQELAQEDDNSNAVTEPEPDCGCGE